MTESNGTPGGNRRKHILRLALFATFLLTLFYFVAVRRVIDIEEVRAALERGIRIGLAAGLAPESIAADFRQALATVTRSIPSPVPPATPPKLRPNPKEADA